MSNGAEAIEANFKQLSKLNNDLPTTGLLNIGKKVWSGTWIMHDKQTIVPSVKLSECLLGWLILWQPYEGNPKTAQPWDLNYTFIPKTHTLEFNGIAMDFPLTNRTQSKKAVKYLYVYDNKLRGHVANQESPQNGWVATRVYAI